MKKGYLRYPSVELINEQMLRNTLSLLLLAVLMSACGGALEEVSQKDEFGYTETYTRRVSDYAREGQWERFDPEGRRVEAATYHNDTLDGRRILFLPSGDTLTVETYRMGRFEGPWRTYYENGQLKLSGQYLDNEMTGEWRRYYDTGELMEMVTFAYNAENGPFVEYYRNGNKKAEGAYRDGDYEHGLLREYNKEGELVRKAQCHNGICRTVWRAQDNEATDS